MTDYDPYDKDSTDVECPTCGRIDFANPRGMKTHHARTHGESIAGVEKECPMCGDTFRVEPGRVDERETCSKLCWRAKKAGVPVDQVTAEPIRIEQECNICGTAYEIPPSQADVRKTCAADDCYREWQRRVNGGENNARWVEKENLDCPICGGTFSVKPSHVDIRVTCGADECYREWRSQQGGKDHPQWNRVELECESCGDPFYVKPSTADWRKTCSHECYGEYRAERYFGPAASGWTGGPTPYLRVRNALSARDWSEIAADVRERDGNGCRLCGISEADGQAHNVHHIVPVFSGGSNAVDLLMTLCDACHMTVEAYTNHIPEIQPVLTKYAEADD